MNLEAKEQKLMEILRGMDRVLVAFSGGVDSAYLAHMANKILGDRALSVTAFSPSVSDRQKQEALQFAQQYGLRHQVIATDEMEVDEYRANPSNRCYFCKQELYTKLSAMTTAMSHPVILDGTNADDLGDFRPGRQAAKELQVRSPLVEAGMTKQDVRVLSRKEGLNTWDKPASACLSSRFPYGIQITEERLRVVDRGEELLRNLGFLVFRVRYHEQLVRIEIAKEELSRALSVEMAELLSEEFRKLGFKFVTLDLAGYRSGSANEVLASDAHAERSTGGAETAMQNYD